MAVETKKYLSLDKLTKYDGKIKDYIGAQDDVVLKDAKDYADSLATNYDAAGSAAGALKDAKAYTDTEVAKANAAAATAQAAAEAADTKAAQGVADAATAQAAADAAQADVDALETLVGTIPESATATDIVGYVQEKTSGIATEGAMTELAGRVTQAEKDIDAIEADYLKAADKTALNEAIALKADQTALDGVSAVANAAVKQSDYNTKVAALEAEDARIAGLVSAEAERAAGVEAGLEGRLVEVETFFKTAEDETLDTALDTLVEIQKYLDGEGEVADQMLLDIAANKKAIEDHAATDHDFGAADEALEAKLNAEIAKKADKTTVEGIDGRLTTAEGKITATEGAITALQGADTTMSGRIDVLEAAIGESGSVADDIATAKQEAIDAAAGDATAKANKALEDAKAYADAEDAKIETRVDALETASATHALASDLNTLAGRVTTAEGEIDTLQTEMDAVEAKAAANEGAIKTLQEASATHATKTALDEEIARAKAAEEANKAAIEAFVEISETEINNLFA